MATSTWLNSPLQAPPNGKKVHFLEWLLLVGDEAQWSSTVILTAHVQLWSVFPDIFVDGFEMEERKKATQPQIAIIVIVDVTVTIDRRTVSNLSVTFQKHQESRILSSSHHIKLYGIYSSFSLSKSIAENEILPFDLLLALIWMGKGKLHIWTFQASSYFPFLHDSDKQILAKPQTQKKF